MSARKLRNSETASFPQVGTDAKDRDLAWTLSESKAAPLLAWEHDDDEDDNDEQDDDVDADVDDVDNEDDDDADVDDDGIDIHNDDDINDVDNGDKEAEEEDDDDDNDNDVDAGDKDDGDNDDKEYNVTDEEEVHVTGGELQDTAKGGLVLVILDIEGVLSTNLSSSRCSSSSSSSLNCWSPAHRFRLEYDFAALIR